jgi:hypothetical protein
MEHYTMAYTHKYTKITLETSKGKTNFLRASLALFVSFIALGIKCLQYNIRFQPTSETLIPKPELENQGPKNPIPWTAKPLIGIPPKTTQFFFFRGLRPRTPGSALQIQNRQGGP